MAEKPIDLAVRGREVRITNPSRIYFPRIGKTKMDLVQYYLSVADAAVRAVLHRPMILKRYVDGIEADPFFQKRAPDKRPDWIPTVRVLFPSGR